MACLHVEFLLRSYNAMTILNQHVLAAHAIILAVKPHENLGTTIEPRYQGSID